MRRGTAARTVAGLALAALALAGCTDSAGPDDDGPSALPLTWQPTGESPDATVVVGERWRAVAPPDGRTALVTGGGRRVELSAGAGRRIGQVLMSEAYAVAVASDRRERRPALGLVVDLADGSTVDLAGPRPAPGGTWSLHGEELRYPTYGADRAYCLTAVHLPSGESQTEHCAPRGEGFSQVTASDAGVAVMTFDDARPVSCRTLVTLEESGPVPVEGVADCVGWDVAAIDGGAVWSEVRDEKAVGAATFVGTRDGTRTELGPGATGSLVACGDSVFFARGPEGGESARLMGWSGDPDGPTVVWSGPEGDTGFVAAPACADDVLTLTYLGESGDQQLWARVPSA